MVGRPLSRAAGNMHEAVVELLLAKDGVDPDSKDEGTTVVGRGERARGGGQGATINHVLSSLPIFPLNPSLPTTSC